MYLFSVHFCGGGPRATVGLLGYSRLRARPPGRSGGRGGLVDVTNHQNMSPRRFQGAGSVPRRPGARHKSPHKNVHYMLEKGTLKKYKTIFMKALELRHILIKISEQWYG